MRSNKIFGSRVLLNSLTIVIFLLFFNSQSMAAIYCVANETDLIAALNNARDNGQDDVIRIQQGTYYGNFVYTSTESFDVTIEGGYSDSFCSVRNVNPENTVLDADGSGLPIGLSNPDGESNFSIDGLKIQNGNRPHISGGGVLLSTSGGSVLVSNCLITSNISGSGGAVLVKEAKSIDINNNVISDNFCNSFGCGLKVEYLPSSSTIKLTGNEIKSNLGGRVACTIEGDFPAPTECNIVIERNTIAQNDGGGLNISNIRGAVTLENNNVSNNDGIGLQIYEVGNVDIKNNDISYNSGTDGGGIKLAGDNDEIIVSNNCITNNYARYWGGAIYVSGIDGDGAINALFINNTITGNLTEIYGGAGIYLNLKSESTLIEMYNNIFWDNNAPSGADLYIRNDHDNDLIPAPVNIYNNDFDHRTPDGIYIQIPFPIDASNLDNIDPSFVDPGNDDYRLKEGSPLINSGTNSAPELPLTDKDGKPRIVGSSVDIGAYEYQRFVAPVAAFTASPLVGVAPLTVSFTDQSTGSIDSWYWNFGDGANSNLQNPTPSYDIPGTYSVSLTVAGDSVSDTKAMSDYITVVSPDAPDLGCRVKEFHSVDYGQKIVVKLEIENSGNGKADPFDVDFYLSDNGIDLNEFLGAEPVNGGLNSNKTKGVTLRHEFPASVSGKFIKAMIDSNNIVLELDETNNTAVIRVP